MESNQLYSPEDKAEDRSFALAQREFKSNCHPREHDAGKEKAGGHGIDEEI